MFAFTFSCSYIAFNIVVNILNSVNHKAMEANALQIAQLRQNHN